MVHLLLVIASHAVPVDDPQDHLVVVDDKPTTLLPLYPRTDADGRVHELLYDRLYYRGVIT